MEVFSGYSMTVKPYQGRTQNTRIRGGIECGRHDVSGIRCKGGEYERGFPPLIWGSGGYPPGKKWEIVVPEKRFKPVLGQNVRFQT